MSCLCSLVSERAQHCSGTASPDAAAASPASAFSYAVGKYRALRPPVAPPFPRALASGRAATPGLHVGSRGRDGAGPALWLLFWASLGCGACVRSVVVSRGLQGAPQGPRLPRRSVSVQPLDLIGSVGEVWRPLQPSTDHSVLCTWRRAALLWEKQRQPGRALVCCPACLGSCLWGS